MMLELVLYYFLSYIDNSASDAINGNAAPGGNVLCCSLHADDRRDAILAGNNGPVRHRAAHFHHQATGSENGTICK